MDGRPRLVDWVKPGVTSEGERRIRIHLEGDRFPTDYEEDHARSQFKAECPSVDIVAIREVRQ